MRRSATDRPLDPAGGLGVEPWRRDDLAAWLKGGLEEEGQAAPGARVWRGIARELSTPPPSGWTRLRRVYASLGSVVVLAYALSFGGLLMARQGAAAELTCAAGCPWDRLSEDEIARQSGLDSRGVDAHPRWLFHVRAPRLDRDLWRSERYDRLHRLEWESAPQATAGGWASVGPANAEMD